MSFETNLRAAGQAIATVRFVCAFGAANKPSDVNKNRMATGSRPSMTTVLDILLVNEYDRLGAEGQTRALRIPIDAALDFMTNNNDTHAFVVIGRSGAATNWTDWGADAVVCDPWLNASPNVSVDGAGASSDAWPFRPAAWAACDLVLGAQTPRKLSSYTFKSEYQVTA